MAIEGSLDEFRLPEILQMVAQQQKTGILTIQGEATIVAISFLGGRVVAADSLDETVEQRLGEVLMRQGMVSRATFNAIAERERRGEGRLIDLLVDSGEVEREQVLDSLRKQTEELLVGLLGWRQGDFKFYGNDEVSYEEGFQPISVPNLLISTLGAEVPEGGRKGAPPADDGGGGGALDSPLLAPPADDDETSFAEASFADAALDAPAADGEVWPGEEPTDERGNEGRAAWVPTVVEEPLPAPTGAESARRALDAGRAADLAAPFVGLLLALLVVAGFVRAPAGFLLPLPWQEGERTAHQAVARQAAYQEIDRAAKTYFLLEGRFPDRLGTLRQMAMLEADDLTDPAGVRLVYRPQADSYELLPDLPASESDELVSIEAITGNFLLDPEFLTSGVTNGQRPLVLLD